MVCFVQKLNLICQKKVMELLSLNQINTKRWLERNIFLKRFNLIDLSITPNRPDCLGVRGIARDLATAGFGTLRPNKFEKIDLRKTKNKKLKLKKKKTKVVQFLVVA